VRNIGLELTFLGYVTNHLRVISVSGRGVVLNNKVAAARQQRVKWASPIGVGLSRKAIEDIRGIAATMER
jgi:hypothetical protein